MKDEEFTKLYGEAERLLIASDFVEFLHRMEDRKSPNRAVRDEAYMELLFLVGKITGKQEMERATKIRELAHGVCVEDDSALRRLADS